MKANTLRAVDSAPDYELPLPSNLEAEQFILGCILLDNTTMNQAAERLKAGDFFSISNQRIYKRMLGLYEEGRGIDPITLQEELRREGELDLMGGPAYIASLFDGVPRFSNIENYVRIVKEKSILRRVITTANFAMLQAFDDDKPALDVLSTLERSLLEISEDSIKKDFRRVGDIAHIQLEAIETSVAGNQMVTGVAMGFTDLDYMTSGLQKSDLAIIAARPGMGKTGLAVNASRNAARVVHPDGSRNVVGIFSLEMSTEQLIMRMLCSDARIDSHRLRGGYLSKDEWRRLAVAVSELQDAELYIDDSPGINLTEMRAKARGLKNKCGRLDLLVVDYLGLMSPLGRPRSDQEATASISRGLKLLAKELDVPLLALSQLSRAPENRSGNHKPQLSDLRNSGAIEQDADLVMFIYREEVYNPNTDKQNIAEIILAKHRNGPVGSVELVFLKQLTRFEDKFKGEVVNDRHWTD